MFERPHSASDGATKCILTSDETNGDIIANDKALIPIAIDPGGKWVSLFHHFLYVSEPLPLPQFQATHPNAAAAARIASSNKVQQGILKD